MFYQTQTACKPLRSPLAATEWCRPLPLQECQLRFLSLVTLTFVLDIQTRPSEGPNMSSLWMWRKSIHSIQPFPRYLMHKQKNKKQKNKKQSGCTTASLPYSTVSKLSLYSNNNFMAKLYTETPSFTSMTEREANQQTNRQTKKTQRFWPPQRRMKSELQQTWHGDRGPWASSCTLKTFRDPTHTFTARGHWKFVGNPFPST